MPRKLRIEFPGAIYHVMSRANGKGNILETDVDRHDFVKTLAETCEKTGFQIHKLQERLLAYPWSTFGLYLAAPPHRPEWLRVDRLLGEHGIQRDDAAGREQFEGRMEARRAEESDAEDCKAIRRGWFLGSAEFKEDLVKKMEGKLGEHHCGELKRESAQAKAERIIKEELKRRKWKESDLKQRAKSDPEKLALAARLRRETTLTLPVIADRLKMGTWKSFRAKLHRWKKGQETGQQV